MKYFSANGEDCLCWQFFDFKKKGFFLDIGAFDGIHFSNTYSFEIQGWQGVCVEPHPAIYPLLTRNRPASICLDCACVSEMAAEAVEFFCEELGLLSTSKKNPSYESFLMERYKKRGLAFGGIKEVTVPALTVDEVIARFFTVANPLDIVSIDVEGAEMDVLQGFDVKRHKPGIIIIEANRPEQGEEIVEHLASRHGYIHAGTLVENLFFVKTRAEAAKIRAIRIECAIEPQMHPLGERFTAERYRTGKMVKKKVTPGLK